ncbi:hypothetical protein [Parasphingorhabdus sp.]|uniref:hypothetical protein n=1 Tax=Parasphingorhabdus sp. TaxID=2709688 RepID=UPI003D2D3F15
MTATHNTNGTSASNHASAASGDYDFSLSAQEITLFKKLTINRKTRAKAEHKLASYVLARFKTKYTRPVTKAELKDIKSEIKAVIAQIDMLYDRKSKTQPYRLVQERVPFKNIPLFDKLVGGAAAATLLGATITIPAVAAISIAEAEIFPLLKELPELGVIFGLSPFAGILSAVYWRDTYSSDAERKKFDRTVLKATAGAFLIFAVLAALTAFPVTLGGEPVADPDNNLLDDNATVGGFSIGVAPAVLLIWTSVLDFCAAPALHIIAEAKLFQKRLKEVSAYPAIIYLEHTLIPNARAKLTKLQERYRQMKGENSAYKNAQKATVQQALIQLDGSQADLELAKSQAVAALFSDAPQQPTATNTGDTK